MNPALPRARVMRRSLSRVWEGMWGAPHASLTVKMAAIVSVGVISLVGVFIYLGSAALNDSVARAMEERVVVARSTAQHVDTIVTNVRQALTWAAQGQALLDPARKDAALASVYSQVQVWSPQVWLVSTEGAALAGYPRPTGSSPNEPRFPASLTNASFTLVRWSPPAGSGYGAALAVTPVLDGQGRAAGLLVLPLDLASSAFRAFVEPVGLGGSVYMDLIDREGVVLASTQGDRIGRSSDPEGVLASMIGAGQAGVSRCDCAVHAGAGVSSSNPEVVAVAPLAQADWGVTVRQDEAEIRAASRDLQLRILALGALALAGALGLVWVTTRSLISPVTGLTRAAQHIAAGEWDAAVPTGRGDEIGALAQAFDSMRVRLKESVAEIQAWNRALDVRVQERTAALAAAQEEARRSAEALRQRNRELSAVNAIAGVVGRSLELDECLRLALAEVHRITDLEVGAIFLVESETSELELQVCYGISEEGAKATTRMALTDAACGGVFTQGREVALVENLCQTTRGSYGALANEGLDSLVHVPLLARGEPLGTLCMGTRKAREFSEQELALLCAIGSQIAVAVENARLYRELSLKEQVRGELLRRLMSAQEDERKRIARELHDETSQTLTALLYAIDGTAANGGTGNPASLERMRQLAVNTLDGVHKIIFDLRPTILDHLGLAAALRWYADTRLAEAGMRVEFIECGEGRRFPPTVETALFRAVQEAVNNIARHSGARHVRFAFDCSLEWVEIQVEDDGIGLDLEQVAMSPDPRCGFGLLSMQERMASVGGECFVTSQRGAGTTITLRAPIEESEPPRRQE